MESLNLILFGFVLLVGQVLVSVVAHAVNKLVDITDVGLVSGYNTAQGISIPLIFIFPTKSVEGVVSFISGPVLIY